MVSRRVVDLVAVACLIVGFGLGFVAGAGGRRVVDAALAAFEPPDPYATEPALKKFALDRSRIEVVEHFPPVKVKDPAHPKANRAAYVATRRRARADDMPIMRVLYYFDGDKLVDMQDDRDPFEFEASMQRAYRP